MSGFVSIKDNNETMPLSSYTTLLYTQTASFLLKETIPDKTVTCIGPALDASEILKQINKNSAINEEISQSLLSISDKPVSVQNGGY